MMVLCCSVIIDSRDLYHLIPSPHTGWPTVSNQSESQAEGSCSPVPQYQRYDRREGGCTVPNSVDNSDRYRVHRRPIPSNIRFGLPE